MIVSLLAVHSLQGAAAAPYERRESLRPGPPGSGSGSRPGLPPSSPGAGAAGTGRRPLYRRLGPGPLGALGLGASRGFKPRQLRQEAVYPASAPAPAPAPTAPATPPPPPPPDVHVVAVSVSTSVKKEMTEQDSPGSASVIYPVLVPPSGGPVRFHQDSVSHQQWASEDLPREVYGMPEENYEVDEALSVLTNGRAHGKQPVSPPTPSPPSPSPAEGNSERPEQPELADKPPAQASAQQHILQQQQQQQQKYQLLQQQLQQHHDQLQKHHDQLQQHQDQLLQHHDLQHEHEQQQSIAPTATTSPATVAASKPTEAPSPVMSTDSPQQHPQAPQAAQAGGQVGQGQADGKPSGYVVEGRNYRKYRVEEKTPDGFIVGEYGVVSHSDGSLRGVRYTADSTINPRLIYDALVKFLSL